MTGIVEFLTASVNDDEAYAREAAEEFGPDWIEIWSGTVDLTANLPDRQPPKGRHWDAHVPTNDSRVSRHMVRHDPTHVLRKVAAMRTILQDYQLVIANNAIEKATGGDEVTAAARDLIIKTLRMVLVQLATAYADRPGYKEEWKP